MPNIESLVVAFGKHDQSLYQDMEVQISLGSFIHPFPSLPVPLQSLTPVYKTEHHGTQARNRKQNASC
jgi:hypothetical protein